MSQSPKQRSSIYNELQQADNQRARIARYLKELDNVNNKESQDKSVAPDKAARASGSAPKSAKRAPTYGNSFIYFKPTHRILNHLSRMIQYVRKQARITVDKTVQHVEHILMEYDKVGNFQAKEMFDKLQVVINKIYHVFEMDKYLYVIYSKLHERLVPTGEGDQRENGGAGQSQERQDASNCDNKTDFKSGSKFANSVITAVSFKINRLEKALKCDEAQELQRTTEEYLSLVNKFEKCNNNNSELDHIGIFLDSIGLELKNWSLDGGNSASNNINVLQNGLSKVRTPHLIRYFFWPHSFRLGWWRETPQRNSSS